LQAAAPGGGRHIPVIPALWPVGGTAGRHGAARDRNDDGAGQREPAKWVGPPAERGGEEGSYSRRHAGERG
jgi:hypothetical protein